MIPSEALEVFTVGCAGRGWVLEGDLRRIVI